MTEPTIAVRVLDELRRCPDALDDDQLAHRLDISPRQTINQVCRRLERAGRLRRYLGPGGKIVNDLRWGDEHGPSALADADRTPDLASQPDDSSSPAAGDSREQRHAEHIMLQLLGPCYGITPTPN